MMKNKFALFLLIGLTTFSFLSCFDDRDDEIIPSSTKEIQNFIWRGLNIYYLYKPNVPALQRQTYANETELDNFLKSFESPETLFYDLIYEPEDRFSFIVSDYEVLEDALQGTSYTNGMEYGLIRNEDSGAIFGYVRYVLPNTTAAEKGIKRGMIFNRVDGIEITANNYRELFSPYTYTIGLANYENGNLTPLDEEYTLTKYEYTENPVYIRKTIDHANKKIGYLMYNGFTSNYDNELNDAFAYFKAENIDDLVIDLRYNGGGSVETSNDLASMVTGQFNGELFTTQVYNDNFENEERYFNNRISTGGTINSLNLNKVYVITTGSTASASELLIASLRPYIDVIQVGTTTTGKYQGSVTLYDSPNFSRTNANIGHKYAMQPLILKTVNANGFTDYFNGLTPNIEIGEDYENLGILGEPTEPLLQAALNQAEGRFAYPLSDHIIEFGESNENTPTHQKMYIDDFDY
ncbi:hypothetical protein FVB9532_01516 [Mesonia oceanica]|uniref:Uncharacterized protein n=1 Tax=Mesonia oceanica TaxID=2687242 RepID=A0AC61Y7T1_9FLAO|nr:hypothetical protein FVB9532_01516 [Mesonia oceanica]|tara:strand:+ start:10091 stop:11485 length:1395 start_codon:yes stop_codon:yes gene_type:complete